jgi:hypothetical protein
LTGLWQAGLEQKTLPGHKEALPDKHCIPSPFQTGGDTVSKIAVDPSLSGNTGYQPYH